MEVVFTQVDGLLCTDAATGEALGRGNPFEYHANFHNVCRSIYANITGGGPQPSPLDDAGFAIIKEFFPEADAQSLSAEFTTLIEGRGPAANVIVRPPDALRQRIKALVSSTLSRGVASFIEGHFGSFFRIDHINCMRTEYSKMQEVSFRWHRDFEPIAQMHIMIYLTPCGENSPATIFANLEDTRRLAHMGYSFPVFNDRVEDINALLDDGEPPVTLNRPELAAGDATIFDAARILHRGHVPEGPYRDIVLLNILPSLNPWQAEFEALDDDTLFTPRDTLWTNPFLPGAPRTEARDDPVVPEWAEQSHFFAG